VRFTKRSDLKKVFTLMLERMKNASIQVTVEKQIPNVGLRLFFAEKPLTGCGCRKFQIDPLGDHLCTCTSHSGAKKAHDWAVDQLTDLFRTTHMVKTRQVVRSRGQQCGDIELSGYLSNATGPVSLVLDLMLTNTSEGTHDESEGGKTNMPI
jgi:hypothetical protein